MPFARKSVKQRYSPTPDVMDLMEDFRAMANDSIRKGLETGASSLKRLSVVNYGDLSKRYHSIPSYYRLTAISKAAGILAARKKSIRRGVQTKDPYLKKRLLVSCYHFKIEGDYLAFSLCKANKVKIGLTKHTLESIKGLEVRSFTLTPTSVSLTVRKNIELYYPKSFLGIDRNASNVTCGNQHHMVQFNLKKVEQIAKTTKEIVRSLKRNDVRVRKILSSKYGTRRRERVRHILHVVSKNIVENAKRDQEAIVFEDIKDIRNLYKKGNCHGRNFRGRMNSVPWFEIKRQVEYKAAWEGVPIIQLTKSETRGTSKRCPACGERLQEDRARKRQLWCEKCKKWSDRDVVAVMNISYRGWLRFSQSKGEAREAMVQEPRNEGVLLQVDASKLMSSVF